MSSQRSEDEDTDTKLAILASLFPDADPTTVFEVLIEAEGSVETARQRLQSPTDRSPRHRSDGRGEAPPGSDRRGAAPASPDGGFFLPPSKRQKVSPPGPGSGGAVAARPDAGAPPFPSPSKPLSVPGQQLSIRRFHAGPTPLGPVTGLSSRKGRTLHLYDAESVAAATPCSIIHNFLPAGQATALLRELLGESATFGKASFQLFERTVSSPHTSSFYVRTAGEQAAQTEQYVYNGSHLTDVRRLTPELERAAPLVQRAVNAEVARRIRARYPGGRKLRFQSPGPWQPNCAFVNCYDGPRESVGAHADQLTYVGPRAVIGSLSLGVEREFRVRRIVPKEDPVIPDEAKGDIAGDAAEGSTATENARGRSSSANGDDTGAKGGSRARDFFLSPRKRKPPAQPASNKHEGDDPSGPSSSSSTPAPAPASTGAGAASAASAATEEEGGQIAIHLPHNSLLVMHAEMQEEWKHAIAPAATLTPHPVAGAKRINVTYRWYRPEFHPRLTPRCACGMPAVLRCVQRRQANHGRYMWMCHVNYTPGKDGCRFFRWARFDDDGRPEWAWNDAEAADKNGGDDDDDDDDDDDGAGEGRTRDGPGVGVGGT